MGAIATIINAISDDVVEALAAANYPPLVPDASGNPGKILVGNAAIFEQASPPRIIFEPLGSKFTVGEYYSASSALGTTERRNQAALRTIASEAMQFTVRCWGASDTGDIADDYDVTRAMYHQVRASIHKLLPGAYQVDDAGKYTQSSVVSRSGREFVFGVTFFTPVLDALLPYATVNQTAAAIAATVDHLRAPGDVAPSGTDHLVMPDGSGSTEAGCD
jgi:hypothetical protein